MPQFAEIAAAGQVRLTTFANLRQGVPSRSAPVLRKLPAGSALTVRALVVGDPVQGNRHWYRLDEQAFVWAGVCSALDPGAAPASEPVGEAGDVRPLIIGQGVSRATNIVDIYHADRVDSFAQARNSGVLGIIHKATTGASGRDDAYHRRRPLALDAGLLWGAYHWGTAAPAIEQVDNFLGWAQPDPQTLVALDFESDVGNQMSIARAREVLTEIEQRLGRRAVIYSGRTIKDALGSRKDAFFGAHRLWLAQYGPAPSVQASWDKSWLWQFTGGKDANRRNVPGIPGNGNGEVDCNNYGASAAQLAAEWAS